MKIEENIRMIREIKGISQDAIATHLDISPQAYGKIERGETKLDFVRIEEIAKYLQVTVDEIMNFDAKNIFKNTFKDQSTGNFNTGESKESFTIIEKLLNTIENRFEKQDKLLEMNMKVIERFGELIKVA
jgi:transcriptional regulator with XRE-family HTH domain